MHKCINLCCSRSSYQQQTTTNQMLIQSDIHSFIHWRKRTKLSQSHEKQQRKKEREEKRVDEPERSHWISRESNNIRRRRLLRPVNLSTLLKEKSAAAAAAVRVFAHDLLIEYSYMRLASETITSGIFINGNRELNSTANTCCCGSFQSNFIWQPPICIRNMHVKFSKRPTRNFQIAVVNRFRQAFPRRPRRRDAFSP